jgi:hypothetical protein
LLAALLALCSCASFDNAPRDTTVRRFDSMSSLALGCDELGAEGWRVASVVELDDGAAFVVVLQRRAVTR